MIQTQAPRSAPGSVVTSVTISVKRKKRHPHEGRAPIGGQRGRGGSWRRGRIGSPHATPLKDQQRRRSSLSASCLFRAVVKGHFRDVPCSLPVTAFSWGQVPFQCHGTSRHATRLISSVRFCVWETSSFCPVILTFRDFFKVSLSVSKCF